MLATVIDISECHPCITAEWIQRCIERYAKVDDVFQIKFLEAILFRGGQAQCSLAADAQIHLEGLGTRWHHFLNDELARQPLPGAYVIIDGVLHEVFRLYADTHAAFFQASRYSTATSSLL